MNKKYTIEDMKKLARKKGGKCISEIYKSCGKKLIWECQDGHQWDAIPSLVIKGTWCPKCGGNKKLTIEEMKEIADSRNGKCLSKSYLGAQYKLEWECSKGHQWEATPGHVSDGQWCPHCARNVRLTIEEMEDIAKSRNGKCLSEKYTNNSTKLLWECQGGHQWDATPKNIKKGKWCPVCARKRFSKKRQSNRPARPGKSK